MKKKWLKKLLAGMLVASMCVTQVPFDVMNGVNVAYAEENNLLSDGDFESGTELWTEESIWTVTGENITAQKSTDTYEGATKAVNISSFSVQDITLTQKVTLPAGIYKLTAQSNGAAGETVDVYFNGTKGDKCQTNSGWGNMVESSGTFTLQEETEVSVGVLVSITTGGGWTWIDDIVLTKVEQAEQTEEKTTLYYYYEGDETLYMNIWYRKGMDFASTVVSGNFLNWGTLQAELQKVDGYDNWYSVQYLVPGSDADGFTIYKGNTGAEDTKLLNCDNEWNNTAMYSTLVGGSSKEYAIKNGQVYTSLEAATAALTKTDLQSLMDTIPSEYESMGFVAEGVEAVKSALNEATSVINKDGATDEEIDTAYKKLGEAIEKLNISAELFIKKVNNYNTDSIRGMDVSSYISVMESFEKVKELKKEAGASEAEIAKIGFKDWNGKVLDEQGFFNFLAKEGVNYIRVKVWNDPVNSTNGKSYGGGHSDLATAVKIGKYATNAGMKLLIDFHLSDFWADPGKQKAPKAWEDFSVDQKVNAVSSYITESLTTLVTQNGVNVGMVQVGNETNNAVCGVSKWTDMCRIFDAGCDAVHAFDENILAAIHFTNPEKGIQAGFAKTLADNDVSYDVFATSYYPNSHGTMENLTTVLSQIAKTYDKYVMVAETAWANTHLNGDGFGDNTYDKGTYVDYNVTVQGQAEEIRDVVSAVNDIDVKLSNGESAALGFFYWEPTWVSVQNLYKEDGTKKDDYDKLLEQNKVIWEECGSGWASSYSAEYDPDDAGMWFGGTSMDNQSVFDFDGNPIYSLKAYNPQYLKYGAVTKVAADGYRVDDIVLYVGESVSDKLPKVTVVYNDSSRVEEEVNWNVADVQKVNDAAKTTSGIGICTITGTLKNDPTFHVEVKVAIEGVNLLDDPGFEKGNSSSWMVTGNGASIKSGEDKKSGEYCIHFYADDDFEFKASATTKVDKAGEYVAYINMQGLSSAGTREGESLVLTAMTPDGTEVKSEDVTLSGWKGWQKVVVKGIKVTKEMIDAGKGEITLIVKAKLNGGAWGTMDDASLYFLKDITTGGGSTDNNNSGSTPTTPTTPPTNTKPDTTTETKPDGSTVETTTETKEDGTKVETVTETAADGSKTETVVETKTDGTKIETVTETATDGSKVETKKESETNTAGKQVDVATVTKTDADGKVASVVEKSTINEVAKNTTATVTVKKDSEGAVTSATASVAATIEGKKTSLSADVIAQVQEASGQKDVAVTVTAKNDEGKTLYKVKVDAKDLTADNALYIYKVDSKTGELVMVNSKTYKVDENGGLDISIKNKATYELVSKAEAKAIEKQIKATVKVQNSSKDVKKGKTTKVAFDKKMNMNNVKSITYQTANKKIATVSKSGKVTAKAKGTVTVKATVTLKNGTKKTVTMKIKVK